jgi:two-component system, LytTR family, response regulator LytT
MNIVIIEDDPIWQLTLRMGIEQASEQASYSTIISFDSIPTAEHFLSHTIPDIVVADVVVQNELSFKLFQQPNRPYPVIFITGYADNQHLQQTSLLPNSTLLIKPFHTLSLIAAIQTLSRLNGTKASQHPGLIVMGKHRQEIKVPYSNILYIEAEGNYIVIQLVDRKYSLKKSLRRLLEDLDERFVQVQKAYVINTDYLNRINLSSKAANINGHIIPIGRMYRKAFIQHIQD